MKKQKPKIEEHIKFVLTTEDWSGSFEPFIESENKEYCNPRNGKAFRVRVSGPIKYNDGSKWCVSCFGTDDCGCNIHFDNRQQALECFELIQDYTSMDDLTSLGFGWF